MNIVMWLAGYINAYKFSSMVIILSVWTRLEFCRKINYIKGV